MEKFSQKQYLGALGYHELALVVRLRAAGNWSGDLPLSESSEQELKDRIQKFWTILLEASDSSLVQLMLRLKLSLKELRILIWTVLPWLDMDFYPLIRKLSQGALFRDGTSAQSMLSLLPPLQEDAYFPEENLCLCRFFFPGFLEGAELVPDAGVIAFFAGEEAAPLWWREAFWEYRPEMETESEILLSSRQERFVNQLAKAMQKEEKELILLGQEGSGRSFFLKQAARTAGRSLLFVHVSEKLAAGNDIGRIAVREALLRDCLLVLKKNGDCPAEAFEKAQKETAEWCRQEGLTFWMVTEEWNHFGFCLQVPPLDRTERLMMWRQMAEGLPLDSQASLEELADRFELSPGQIRDILKLEEQERHFEGKDRIGRAELFSCCHRRLKRGLNRRARKIEPRYSWEDLLLEERQKEKLLAAERQIRYRSQVFETWGLSEKQPYGCGISLVFSGPPGTGKTMAAQVLAGRMGLELYRVELPAVVSKFIGETEQNLNEIFEEAQSSQAALFFDEADVLFGKRTDVRDSNDKYSNMEAAFLLQKMEDYNGVTILATNFLRNMDEAFKRRIRFLVEFPFPDAQWRLRIWKQAFPKEMPLSGDLDLDFLASAFELSGAGIRNTVMQAAFFAAARKEPVSMAHLVQAACQEMEKSGRTMSETEFGIYKLEEGKGERRGQMVEKGG